MGRVERRKRIAWLQFLWASTDALAIQFAFLTAYWLRFLSPLTDLIPVTKGIPSVWPYASAAVVLTAAWLPIFRSAGMYEVAPGRRGAQSFLRIARASFTVVLVGAAITFFYREFSFSRAFFPLLFVCLVAYVWLGRRMSRAVTMRWRRRQPLRVAVVGESAAGGLLADRLLTRDPTGTVLVARFLRDGVDPEPADEGTPVIGSYRDVARGVVAHDIHVLVLALPLADQVYAAEIVTACRGLSVDIEMVPDTYQLLSRRAGVRDVDGLPVLSLREIPLTGWNAVKKRTFDLVVASVLFVLASPVLAAVALLVKLTSPGPVLYRQERLGRDGRRFAILKFRSMRQDAESTSGPVWATADDGRRTRIGNVLRQWSVDELPQLINVLRGEMSLVGPRPERPFFVEQFEGQMPDYVDRHRVKSGITGWAQVNGLRGDTPIEMRTQFDNFYVENWSLALDVKILFRTLRAVASRDGAV